MCAHLIYGIVLGGKRIAHCPDILVLYRTPDRKVQSLRLRNSDHRILPNRLSARSRVA